MKFATLDGKLVQSGGMVVKNVAGLDMGKLMIGSFGTLAALATVNFKLVPRPHVSRTVLYSFDDIQTTMEVRDAAIRGVLNPAAVDVINPVHAAQLGLKGYILALMFAGSEAVIERGQCEAEALGSGQGSYPGRGATLPGSLCARSRRNIWKNSRTAQWPAYPPRSSECGEALASVDGPGHAHAASGIVRAWFSRPDTATRWLNTSVARGWKGVIEFSSDTARRNLTLWPAPAGDFEIMKRIKNMFDPEGLLNSGRLYGLI